MSLPQTAWIKLNHLRRVLGNFIRPCTNGISLLHQVGIEFQNITLKVKIKKCYHIKPIGTFGLSFTNSPPLKKKFVAASNP